MGTATFADIAEEIRTKLELRGRHVAWKRGNIYGREFAGSVCPSGYIRIRLSVKGTLVQLYAHQVCWILLHGEDPRVAEVDHIDGDRLNNSRENLRLVTHAENVANQRPLDRSKSGLLGVYRSCMGRKLWEARTSINDRPRVLGYFEDPRDAVRRYWEYRIGTCPDIEGVMRERFLQQMEVAERLIKDPNNLPQPPRKSRLGIKGVIYFRGKFGVQIYGTRKESKARRHLGDFDSCVQAVAAYHQAAEDFGKVVAPGELEKALEIARKADAGELNLPEQVSAKEHMRNIRTARKLEANRTKPR